MSKKNEKHYVIKEDLWQEIKEFYDSEGAMGNTLGVVIDNIANKIMTSQNFSGYPYKQEMISDAVLRMVTTLSERKFKLWSDAKCKKIQYRSFVGYKVDGEVDLEKGEVLQVNSFNIFENIESHEPKNKVAKKIKDVSIFDIDAEHFFHEDIKGVVKKTPCWKKNRVAKGVSIVKTGDPNDFLEIHTYIESDKKVNGRNLYVVGDMYDKGGKVVRQKSNAFGYLSQIAKHEAVTRIKKEKKNTDAIRTHQEDEMVSFQSENCEMTPQRIFDDSYESYDSNNE
jgi:hypothetical protein